MASKYLDAYLQQKAGNGRKQDEENKSTSSTGRGAGSAAASGRSGNGLDFLQRLQNETRNLYSRQQSGTPGAASPTVGTQPQGSLYAQIAKQMRGTQRPNLYSGTTPQSPAATAPLTQGSQYSQPQPVAMPGLTGAQRQMIAERNNANGPLAASANPNDWSGDAAMYLQAGGDIDRATVRGLDYSQRRFIGDMAGGVRNAVNEAGYLYQSGRESMKDPTKGPNIEEQLLYDFATDPHAMDAYNAWRASLKPGEYETMEMMGQLPSPGQLYVQQRMREMGEEFQANYEEPELKRITNMGENFQKETEQLYGDMTGGWKTAADLAGSIGQQVPAMALRVIPVVGPALSNAYFFGSAAGASTEEAYADGASLQQAVDYGALSGAVEMLTEHVFDGMSGLLGKGAADDAVEGLIHALTRRNGNNALRNGLRWTFGALGEAGEEGISALVDPLLRTVYNNKTVRESYKDLDWEDVWNQVLLGGLSGGVLSSIGLANGQFKGKNAELDARVANEVVNDFLTNTPEGQALAQQAENNLATQNAPRTNQGAENGQTGPYASIETLPNGNKYVKADRQVIHGDDPEAWGNQITNYINDAIRQGMDVPVTTIDGDTLLLTRDTAGKAGFRNSIGDQHGSRPMNDSEYRAKLNAEAHIDELSEISRMNNRNSPPVKDRGERHSFAKDGWKYRTVFFMDHDGTYYRITLSTGADGNLYTVYNVGEMNRRSNPTFRGSSAPKGGAPGASSIPTILQQEQNSNNIFSQEGVNNGEQSDHGTPENGNDGVRAGEQGTGISELGEEGTLPGGEGQVRAGVSESRGENLRSVTLREMGVTNAAESATIQVQDEQSLTGDAARAAQQVRQQGLEPVAFRGEMIVNGASVNGYIENGRVFFRTDAKYRDGTPISSESIVRHESVHNAKDSDPGIIDIGMEIVRRNRSEAEVLEMMDAYRETYKDLYDFEKMSEEDITDMLVEEIVADAYAGMNYFRDGGETVEQVRTAIGNQVESTQNVEAGTETRGPPRALAAGRNAKTADSRSLSRAEEMERNGAANEEIRQATGWYRGRDGQWRFEIDDSGAKYYRNGDAQFRKDHPEYARYQDLMSQFLTGNLNGGELMELQALEQTWGREQGRLKELVDSGRATLGMILDHVDLFEAYPELRDARVRFADLRSGEKGYYDPRHNNLTISNELRNAPEDTLVHEIQHAVQDIEGFSGGASAEYWENQEQNGNVSGWKSEETMALEKEYQELLDSLPEETRQMIREVNQAYADSDFERIDDLEDQLANGPYGNQYYDLMALEGRLLTQKDSDRKINAQANYLNTAGEIEARDAANRRGMTAEKRKNTPPDLGDENTVFVEGNVVSFRSNINLEDMDIPWDPDNESSIKEQVTNNLDRINSMDPVTTVEYDRKKGKKYYEQLDDILRTRFGYKIDRQGFGTFLFDKEAIATIRHYVGSDAEAAAAIAAPYVLKRGEIISGHRNHNNGRYPSVTFAAPVVLNGKTGVEAVTVLFADKDRVHSLRILAPDGSEFVLTAPKNETGLEMEGVDANASITRPTSSASMDSILQSSEKSNTQNNPRASAEVTSRRSLERELQERQEAYQKASDRNDTEYDYRGELAKIRELEQRLEGMREEKIPHQSADSVRDDSEGENDTSSAEQSSAPSPQGEGSEMEAARAELLENGKATMENDTGTYTIELQEKAGNDIRARIRRDGKLDRVQSFENREEAAEYALSYVDGQTKARTDAELDRERSEQREKPGPHWPTGKEYGEEIVRQKQNKAADAATQTLRERIRRANEELKALRRLEKTTGLTDQQRAHMNDVQETLDIMNDELTSRKGRRTAKKEKARTKGAVENKPTRSAADAKNALMEQFHTAAGERAEVGRQIEAKLNEIARSGRITDENRQALYDLLIENGVVPKHAESTYQEIRNSLRGQRIFVNEQERADLGDDFETLRRRAWANGIYLTNNPNDGKIDTVNMEMAEAFGENLFPTNEALSDMLSNMIDQAELGRTVQQSLHESIRGEARETGRSANEIYSEMFSQMDETLRTFAEKAGLEVALKDRTATQLAEERQRWEDRLERRAQARRESEVRGKVLRGLQRLSKLRGKAGPEIRAQVGEVLKDIDTQARQITPAGLENLQALQRAYEEAREAAGYVDGENMGNWIPKPYIEERLAALTKKHVNDMSLEEVVDLGRTVAGLENAIRTQNQMIGEEFDATIEESAKGVREDVESSRGAKAGFLHKWLMEEHLSPRRFLDMLGGWKTDGAMSKLSKSLEDGQTRMLDYQRRAVQSFDPFLSKKANRQWLEKASGKKAEWTSYTVLDGYSEDGGSYKTIELTPMMKISLYLHSRNMDNLRHIQTGGIVIPNKALYQKGKMAEAYAQGERIRMNPETVRKIAGELTETERTFANHMITLFDNISKDAINEVSLQLDGFERAGVENYMPIETDRSFLKSDVAGEARAATVEGIGSIANERVHASNPIMLSDASDVLMRQIDKVSRYYGYAIPIRNFQAVNNFVFHEEGAPFSTSIKEIMDRKWGSGAEQYITKMLEDLQSSGRRGDMMSSALSKLRGNLAGATLMFNPSVAVSQTASYPGAAQAVGWDGLAHGLVAGRVDPKLIEKYSPLYWYRNQGNSTQELGDYMSDKGLEQKLPWIMNWIQKMDSATIRRLWAASEYRVSKDNPGLRPGSQADIDAGKDAYYQKVAEVFNRAVYDTQPNYTNMERAQILRSNSDVTRFLTMYKTVPLQYYGMMVEATGRLQAAMKSGDQAKITEARKYAVNTFGGLLAANTVYVAMKALFKGFRKKDKDYRDEEGNLTAGSVAAQLGKDLAETYAGSIIGGAEMYSVAESLLTGSKFYGPEMSALSYVEDMVGAVNSIFKSIGEEDPRKAAGAIKDAAVTLAQGFGVPAQNMETYLMAGVRWMFPDVAMEYDNLFGGIERGDMKGMDEQAVGTATNLILQNRTGLKIDQSVTDELARLYSVGELAAIPTNTPSSFSYNGKTVQISDRGAYSDTWGGIVGDNLEDLVTTDDYVSADDGQRAALVNKLYQYATVEARRGADPEYSAEGNSTYGWTVKADEAVEAGVGLVDAICALDAFSHMTADKDENGNSISGSKKAKVCDYIDAMDITDEQKDVMYLLSGYKENSLEYTPWHGWDEDEEDGSGSRSGKGSGSGKSSGGKKGRGGGSRKAAAPKEKAVKGSGSKIQLPKAARTGGSGSRESGGMGGNADASLPLIEIIDRYYEGNALAAAMDGGARARGRTTVDFEL